MASGEGGASAALGATLAHTAWITGSKIGTASAAAGRAAAERAALAVGIVVADPDRDGDVVGEAHEPGIVLVVGGAGLAGDEGRKLRQRARGAARQHALQHGLELIEGGAVDGADVDRRPLLPIDRFAIALDQFDDIGDGTHAFIGDRRIERREIDRPHRLGAEHERIISHAFAINLRLQRQIAKAIEAGLGLALDAAIEQPHGRKIARILQRAAQGQRAAAAAVVILRRPVVLLAGAAAAEGGSLIASSNTSVLGCRPLPSAAR